MRKLTLAAALLCMAHTAAAQEAAISVYGQTSSQHATHLMPQVIVRSPSSFRVRVEASYLVDVASRASIDLRTGQNKQPQRTLHELSARLGVDTGTFRLGSHYRYVQLPDYVSHTLDLPLGYAPADGSAKLSLQPYLRWNEINRLGDPKFDQTSRMFGARASYAPWLGGRTVAVLTYELQHASGYLSSPYNYIGVGGTGYYCVGATFCLPEHNPERRTGHAFVLAARRALGETLSAGLSYRFFIDDWSMTSHLAEPDIAWMPWSEGLLRLRYRAYVQSATRAYQSAHSGAVRATDLPTDVAGDALWAALQTHRVSLELGQTLRWDDATRALNGFVSLGVYRVAFADSWHESSTALEATLQLTLVL